jgi:hypothetical protein
MAISEPAAVLPPLYARWMDALLADPIPPETRATCEDCAMCAPEGAADADTFYFSPSVKCCSYQPKLPNYLVGRALEDRDFAFSAGRATLESRIDAGLGVTPLGVETSAMFKLIYQHGHDGFGRADALRCPHYLDEGGGRCGIWRNRNSVCATWFCKHERGAVGIAFWNRLRDLLVAVEESLATWCVLESDLERESIEALFPLQTGRPPTSDLTADQLDGRVPPAIARRLWGKLLGREREFYRECAKRVETLAWRDVERIGGAPVSARARLTREAFALTQSQELPERLQTGTLQVISTAHDGVRVSTYSGSDPLDLAPAVFEVLPYFDGRPTVQAVGAIRRELGVEVEKDLVRKLSDFKILVEPKQT